MTSTWARDRRALKQLALNVHVKHSDLTYYALALNVNSYLPYSALDSTVSSYFPYYALTLKTKDLKY